MPAHSPAARRAVFDHESESRPRRRAAPDWGGDDLFDHDVPRRRRFARDDEAPSARHREADEAPPRRRPQAASERPAPVAELIAARRAEYEAPAGPTTPTPTPPARRTVTVTGRPGPAFAPRTAGPARSRGPRTVEERISARPAQLVAWAFALGLLLIALSVLTA